MQITTYYPKMGRFFWALFAIIRRVLKIGVEILVNGVYTRFTKISDPNFKTRLIMAKLGQKNRPLFG